MVGSAVVVRTTDVVNLIVVVREAVVVGGFSVVLSMVVEGSSVVVGTIRLRVRGLVDD